MTTRGKGTGLGLAIVKKIVEEHFGEIEFDDGPGGGSLVRMIFDAERSPSSTGDAATVRRTTCRGSRKIWLWISS